MRNSSQNVAQLLQQVVLENPRNVALVALVTERRGLSVFEGRADSVEIADEIKVGVMAQNGDCWGCVLVEQMTPQVLTQAIDQAYEVARFSDPEPLLSLTETPLSLSPTGVDPGLFLSMPELESKAKELEDLCRQASPRIVNVPHAACGHQYQARFYANSRGVFASSEQGLLAAFVSVTAQGQDQRYVSVACGQEVLRGSELSIPHLADEASHEVISRLDAKKIVSGSYPVLIDRREAAQLLGQFAPVFSGEALVKKLTRLEGRQGQLIAACGVHIVDSPQEGLSPVLFDAEGMAVTRKAIVEAGVLKTFLHNRLSAAKTGLPPTGNAHGGLGSLPQVGPLNLFWDGQGVPVDQLLKQMDRGLWIKDLQGAQASPISGDFSYGASGFWVEGGKVAYPVSDLTLAGNFFELLQNLVAQGDDLRFYSPHVLGSLGGRSLLISTLSASG